MLFSLLLLFFVLILLVLLSVFFSGSKMGLMSLNRYRLRHLVKENNKKAIRVNNLLSKSDVEEATVEDIMVPTADIVGLDLEKSWQEVLLQLETVQHTRLPLYKGSIDQLVGVVDVRTVLALALKGNLDMGHLIAIADKPYFIPEGTLLNLQIANFQREKKQSCFVVDEYGDLQGLVTMKDILEEVVGEFTTEIADFCNDILHESEGCVIVDASITLRHLKRMLGWILPSMGPRTLSGLIIEYLGYIPPANCCLSIENYRIEILKVNDNMIKTVRMSERK